MPVIFLIRCDFCQSEWAPNITAHLSPRAYSTAIEYRLSEGSRCTMVDQDFVLNRTFRVLDTGEVACRSCQQNLQKLMDEAKAKALEEMKH